MGENIKDAWQLCCESTSPCSAIFITSIAEALKVSQINPALSRFGKRGKNHTITASVARQCKPFPLYAIVNFPKALYVLESQQWAAAPPSLELFLSRPHSLSSSSIHPIFLPLPPHPTLPSHVLQQHRIRQPVYTVPACHRTGWALQHDWAYLLA